jgi:transposase-like protein
MALSAALRHVDLTLPCARCSHPIVRNGYWFVSVSVFKCPECKGELRLGYREKVALFDRYARLA